MIDLLCRKTKKFLLNLDLEANRLRLVASTLEHAWRRVARQRSLLSSAGPKPHKSLCKESSSDIATECSCADAAGSEEKGLR